MIVTRAMHTRLCSARELLVDPGLPGMSIAQLAARVNVSPFHLTRQFAAVFGATPHQFRTAARVARARQLLASGELTVTEVCFELGFSSLGSFSALFSARTGESPLAYQRRMRRLWSVPGPLLPVLNLGCFSLMSYLPAQFSRSAPAREALDTEP